MAVSALLQLAMSILLFTVKVHSQYPPCCTFVSNTCDWSPGTNDGQGSLWSWSNDSTPDLTGITDFDLSSRPGYLYLQDTDLADSAISNANATSIPFAIYFDDYIGIDVYRNVVNNDGGSQPAIYLFDDAEGTALTLDISSDSGWVTNTFQCNDLLTCCSSYPCYVHIEVVGFLYDKGDLLAFDNIGVNTACAITEEPTCCRFEDLENCNWQPADRWYSSINKHPVWVATKGVMTHSSEYMWTQDGNGDPLVSRLYTDISSTSSFNFQYYGDVTARSDRSSYLSVRFETPAKTYELARLRDTNMTWIYYSIDCSVVLCCGGDSVCNGYLDFLTIYSANDEALYAVDNVETAGGCGDPECCTYSSSEFCGWTDGNTVTYPWKWSGINTPNPNYLSGNFTQTSGHYAWLQVIEAAAQPDSVLVSPDIASVDSALFLSISYYIEADESSNKLLVYFQEDNVSDRMLLTTLSGTGETWQSGAFACNQVTGSGSCCQEGAAAECSGHFEIDASNANGTVFYAIDNVEINGQCVGRLI